MKKALWVVFAAAMIALMYGPLAHADMYKWIDDKGTVHFTDDITKIPEQYLPKDDAVRSRSDQRRQADETIKEAEIQRRKDMRKAIDTIFLDHGMDVYVKLWGDLKDTLVLEWVLWSRPSVYKFTNGGDLSEGSFLSNLKKAGFKEVIFDNHYDYRVSYDLTK